MYYFAGLIVPREGKLSFADVFEINYFATSFFAFSKRPDKGALLRKKSVRPKGRLTFPLEN